MTGSEKQIKWAEDIRSKVQAGFDKLVPNDKLDIATSYIMSIEDARFWIDDGQHGIDEPMGLLMLFAGSGLSINGNSGDKVAKINEQTGEITVSTKQL